MAINMEYEPGNVVWVIALFIGVVFFMVGMHGIDNARNLAYVQNAVGGEWTDSNAFGVSMTPDRLYNQSVMVVLSSFIVSVFSAVMIYHKGGRVRIDV